MRHFKYLMISLVMMVSLLGCGSGLQTPVRSPDALHSHITDSTVALVYMHVSIHKDKETGEIDNVSVDIRPNCTGVWISDTEMATAAHCVADEEADVDPVGHKQYYVVSSEVKEVLDDPTAIHMAKVVAVDVEHDVALLKAEPGGMPSHSSASLASEMPAIGEHVYSVGHPKGMYYTHAEGTVSAYRNETSVGKAVQVNATIWYGNSGGGVFDSGGNLVGICSRLTRVPMMNYFVHIDSVKRLVKEYHTPSEDLSKK